MRATARRRRTHAFQHDVRVRDHHVSADEPIETGGDDTAPSPQELLAASLASCTAITIEMYAERKGWDVGRVEVDCEYTPAERGCPTRFELVVRLPDGLSEDQIERLMQIAAKCPVHRTLDGEVMFDERVELVAPVDAAAPTTVRPRMASLSEQLSALLLAPEEAAALDVRGRIDAAVLVPALRRGRRAPRGLHPAPGRPAPARRRDLVPGRPAGHRGGGPARHRAARGRGGDRAAHDAVELVGALTPTPTVVTNYAIYPFVGVIEPGHRWLPCAAEVAEVLELSLPALRERPRAQAPGPPRRPLPHRRLHRGRPGHLGRDRADPHGPARAGRAGHRLSSSTWPRNSSSCDSRRVTRSSSPGAAGGVS